MSHPLFFYGQTYDAGSGLLAHAAAVLFYINKVSALDLKLTGFLLWILVAAVVGATVWKWLGQRAAGIAVALYLWCPTSVEWALKGRGGYMVALLFTITTIGLALRGSKTFWQGAAVGGCGAVAIWAQPSVAPVVAVVFLWLAIESVYQKRANQHCRACRRCHCAESVAVLRSKSRFELLVVSNRWRRIRRQSARVKPRSLACVHARNGLVVSPATLLGRSHRRFLVAGSRRGLLPRRGRDFAEPHS